MIHIENGMALKEWAVTVQALGEGTQLFVLRKGGIREETRHFELQSDTFFLYPSFEHQRAELLKPEYRSDVAGSLNCYTEDRKTVTISYAAKCVMDLEVLDEEALRALDPFHIGTTEWATERLKWKRTLPLHVLMLRVYRLQAPLVLDVKEEYLGCKSWIQLPISAPFAVDAVCDEDVFEQKIEAIREKLSTVVK